jgi:hypothetical protein
MLIADVGPLQVLPVTSAGQHLSMSEQSFNAWHKCHHPSIDAIYCIYIVKISSNKVRWPSWLWRQVKVNLNIIPGHESGVGSSPTLISIRLASS